MAVNWILVGATGAALSVALGAFGAHALEARLSDRELTLWETAARYLMYSALGLVAIGLVSRTATVSSDWTRLDWAATALALGGAVFSGTVAALALGGPRWMGAVTPLGGALMIAGWVLFAWASTQI